VILEKLRDNPWRFAAGDVVYIAGHEHYLVVDHQGHEWTVPQQCLARLPVVP
jgi:hypothetical protein